jgi:hypothetical protein
MGIYDSLRDSFSAKGTEKIADFFCAATVALLICPPVMERASELSQVVCELSDYMELSLPVLCGILTASGNVSSAGVFHFFVYQAIAFAGNLFSGILLPLTGSYISIGNVSNCYVTGKHSTKIEVYGNTNVVDFTAPAFGSDSFSSNILVNSDKCSSIQSLSGVHAVTSAQLIDASYLSSIGFPIQT